MKQSGKDFIFTAYLLYIKQNKKRYDNQIVPFCYCKLVVKTALYKCYKTLYCFFLIRAVSNNSDVCATHNAE